MKISLRIACGFILSVLLASVAIPVPDALAQDRDPVPAPAASSPEEQYLFNEGSSPVPGWVVVKVINHRDFRRVLISDGARETGVEIIRAAGRKSEFCSKAYCVQPAPGSAPDVELLASLAGRLPVSQAPDFPDLSVVARPKAASVNQGESQGLFKRIVSSEYLFAGLLVALGMCLIPLLAGLARTSVMNRKRMLAHGLIALCIATAGLVAVAVRPEKVVILQDGTSYQTLSHIYGVGVHGSPLSVAVGKLANGPGPAVRLHGIVRLNNALTMVNTALLFLIAAAVLGSVLLAAPISAAYYLAYSTRATAESEYPAAPITMMIFLAVIVWAALRDRRVPGWVGKAAGLIALGLIAVIVTGLRTEYAGVAIMSLACAAAVVLLPEERLAAWSGAFRGFFARMLAEPKKAVIPAVIFVVVCGLLLVLERVEFGPARWAAGALNPANHALSTVPVYIFWFIPAPLAALALAGLIHTIRRPVRFLLLPLSALFLFRLHAVAGAAAFSTWMRHLTVDMPLFFLLAVFGLKVVKDIRWPAHIHRVWGQVAAMVVALTVLVFPATAANPGQFPWRGAHPGEPARMQNPQIEVNYLMTAIEQYPDCVFVTRVLDHLRPVDVYFGRNFAMTTTPVLADSGCTIVYRSMDCNLLNRMDCADLEADATVIDELKYENMPYGLVHPYHEMEHNPEIRIGLYRRHH